jgi:hypothetical protein
MKVDTIHNLFYIVYGQKEYHNKEWLEGDEGKNMLISSKGIDNGVYGFFNIENKYKPPIITVQGYGTIGQAFVQEYDCSVDDHMLILIPKEKMDIYLLYSIAYQIRLTKWKYKYGRGITPDRIKRMNVIIDDLGVDWNAFEKEITPKENSKEKIIENTDMQWKKILDKNDKIGCTLDRRYFLYINQLNLDKEKTPYVTTTERNNGVFVFCGEEPIIKSRKITIALDGKCGEAFFQIEDFISGEKTGILDHENKHFLIYIGMCIKFLSWKFHYGRKLSFARLKEMKIPIPFKNGKIDYDYIEKLLRNCYGYDELRDYFT